jgi:hypothetical protein
MEVGEKAECYGSRRNLCTYKYNLYSVGKDYFLKVVQYVSFLLAAGEGSVVLGFELD